MILTEEFLKIQKACNEGIQACIENNYIGQEYSDVIRSFISTNQKDFAGWLIDQKKSETYIRSNGTEIIMGAYHVFNPLTGTHIECQTADEARNTLSRLYKELIDLHKPSVCQSISNENGDSTWVPVELVKDIQINIL